ncbi:probably inactive leucine-rich repeat receptor-like protein kinase At5g06940 [Amborella trichopoda]|uniref:Protein kinase domain-containing protein n=1 Tax=Amborella trichopoda TaxID=13333 RepID=W1PVL8_AMBTC|nr:probably inactive leucine-rich repeat receptor-like protein kinase At5g06940 [Amborella trichopoda]ERN11736.1 hypothetical protein AMTR_s00022p00238610 [Amborella trichopoda]|eukprot:XP_006850155.1 probably inactive leucine-rich repeat receptor-like protein kinase At5g06940 [Amborella trichopoda]
MAPPSTFFSTFMAAILCSLSLSSASEMDILLSFKSSIRDPNNSLSSWNPTNAHPCNWTGIQCNPSSLSILSLDLHSLFLYGEFPLSVCQLPLSNLNLANNLFNQPLSLQLSQCHGLKTFNLSNNLLWGTLPDQLSLLKSMEVLDLSKNHFEGHIPYTLGNLQSLKVLNLANNLFTGKVPSIFGNFTELEVLDLSENQFLNSDMPLSFSGLHRLRNFFLQGSGFHGRVPGFFGDLQGLEVIDLSLNNFSGELPINLGSKTKLLFLDVSGNRLNGAIPSDICHGNTLIHLGLQSNSFTGSVPSSLEKCLTLEKLLIHNNALNGNFPVNIWSLPKIKLIRAENNRLSGFIPSSVSMATTLEQIQIDNNSFNGTIPSSLGKITTFYRLSASHNNFNGEIPEDLCNPDSSSLSIINLSRNSLSGRVPDMTNCKKLVSFSLAGNDLTGEIPNSLSSLPVLTYIDLSSNNLTGLIPPQLTNLKLALFNVSFNQLSGHVPPSLISGLPASFFQGNPGLCGPGLPDSCEDRQMPAKKHAGFFVPLCFVGGILMLFAGVIVLYASLRRMSCLPKNCNSISSPGVSELEVLSHLEEKNSIGAGNFGHVYRVQLPNGKFVVVKKLMKNFGERKLGKSLMAQLEKLQKIRHKNIAELLGFCYSEGTMFLVYDYFENGSLERWVCGGERNLGWDFTLRIAVGVARGLAHLHSISKDPILHRNIKASNVVLGIDFEPKIIDLGLNLIVGEADYQASMDSGMGSYCNRAPECGYSTMSTEQMDVYAFGVLLLELVTGKQAGLSESGEMVGIVKWVRGKVNTKGGAFKVLDPKFGDSFKLQMVGALQIALNCTTVTARMRPTMNEVVEELEHLDSQSHVGR